MSIETVVTASIFYALTCCMALMWMEDAEGHEIALWQLVVVKALLIGIYKILFTGWRIDA